MKTVRRDQRRVHRLPHKHHRCPMVTGKTSRSNEQCRDLQRNISSRYCLFRTLRLAHSSVPSGAGETYRRSAPSRHIRKAIPSAYEGKLAHSFTFRPNSTHSMTSTTHRSSRLSDQMEKLVFRATRLSKVPQNGLRTHHIFGALGLRSGTTPPDGANEAQHMALAWPSDFRQGKSPCRKESGWVWAS